MKQKKIILYLILIVICFLYLIQTSYSKYKKSIEGDLKSNIAKWNIKVNDELITNKNKLTNNITPVFTGNKYSKDDVIAPGVEGYYDITIDSKNTDYTFDYTIYSKVSKNSDIKDLITTKYIINPDTDNIEKKYNDKIGITNTVTKPSIIKLRIYIKWNDNVNETMNNQKDTEIAVNKNSLGIMEVEINFKQKNNEN